MVQKQSHDIYKPWVLVWLCVQNMVRTLNFYRQWLNYSLRSSPPITLCLHRLLLTRKTQAHLMVPYNLEGQRRTMRVLLRSRGWVKLMSEPIVEDYPAVTVHDHSEQLIPNALTNTAHVSHKHTPQVLTGTGLPHASVDALKPAHHLPMQNHQGGN